MILDQSGFGIGDWWSVINSFDRLVKYITSDAEDDRHASLNLVYDSKAPSTSFLPHNAMKARPMPSRGVRPSVRPSRSCILSK